MATTQTDEEVLEAARSSLTAYIVLLRRKRAELAKTEIGWKLRQIDEMMERLQPFAKDILPARKPKTP